jgi:hypothetical protein
MNHWLVRGVAVVGFVLMCAGCGSVSLTQVKQFGAASSALGEQAREAFRVADAASLDRNIYDVAGDPGRGPTDATFQGLFSGDAGVLGGKEQGERLALRLAALDQLSAYSGALQELAEADVGKDIDAAAAKLTGSLIGLRDTYRKASGQDLPLGDADIGIIATAVDAIGRGVVEGKRRAAVKSVILRADPAVQKVTGLIAADLGSQSDLASFVQAALTNSRGSVQQAYNLERVRPASTFDARYAMLLRARQIYDAERATPAFFAAVSAGASAAGQAHQALRKAVEADRFSSAEVAKLIGELEAHVKSVQAFHKTLRAAD